ncbi:hypothetical protein DFP72DRAFT_1043316 [Ephemerocybe angulata]|uniref:F-box domain-containing protein n=1 Tax=Ephemerocybe angulata TaxID=980116 RepID=A0A8H6MAU9_9AGAR|nr:hypothetical protein DFP72DRAFT_1043316 [Tulosesus angulatus]
MEEVIFQDLSESHDATSELTAHSHLLQERAVGGDKGHHGGPIRSCLTNVPNEVWQQIFSFAQTCRVEMWHDENEIDPPEVPEYRNLATICAVSRSWRQIAIGHHKLWTYLPTLMVCAKEDSRGQARACDGQNAKRWIQLFLSRAGGSLPLACDIIICPKAWAQDQGAIQDVVKVLTDQCHRWGIATFYIPQEAIAPLLSCIEGKLPMLSTLMLDTSIGTSIPDSSDTYTLNIFWEAPKLRTAGITWIITDSFPNVEINLPWSQLERVGLSVPGGSLYKNLIEAQPLDLKELRYSDSDTSVPPTPPTPIILPKLEHFSVHSSEDEASFIDHLDQLTLPALKYFSYARPGEIPPDDFYVKILSLIQRSGCSLEKLDLQPKEVPTTNPVYFDILALSPRLTTIKLLRKLVLDPASPKPFLPALQTLELRDEPWRRGPRARLDVNALMSVVRSRTLDLPQDSTGGETGRVLKPLDTVVISSYDMQLLYDDLTLWESQELGDRFKKYGSPDPLAFPSALTPSRAESALRKFRALYYKPPSEAEFFAVAADMGRLLDELEALDIGNTNTSMLVRRGFLHQLNYYAGWKEVVFPVMPQGAREVIHAISTHAKHILDCWRPFILRDLAACPYVWEFDDWDNGGSGTNMTRWHVRPEEGTRDEPRTRNSLSSVKAQSASAHSEKDEVLNMCSAEDIIDWLRIRLHEDSIGRWS